MNLLEKWMRARIARIFPYGWTAKANRPEKIGTGCQISSKATFAGRIDRISLGERVVIEQNAYLHCHDDTSFLELGDRTIVMPYAVLMTYPGGRIRLGRNCSVNPFCVLYGHGGLEIGDDVRIATHTVIVPANHVFSDTTMPIRMQGLTKKGVEIESDVWIGAGVTILDGCRIGRGSVIAAGAVITESIPQYSVVAGVPARIIGRRGADEPR